NDVLSPLTLADWAIFVMEGLPGDLDEKLDELTGYSKWVEKFRLNNKDKNIQCKALEAYPFNLGTTLPASLLSNGLVIVSASANDEAFPLKFKEWNHLELSGGYSDDEFREWCKLRNYDIDEDPQLKLHLDKVKFRTEYYPLELDLWHWTDEINFENKTSKYMNKRESEIALAHEAFRDRLSEEEKQILTTKGEILSYNDMGEKTLKSVRTLLYTPLARRAIINSHKQHPLHELKDIVSTIFRSSNGYSNDTKGRLVELKPGGNSPVYNNVMNMHKVIKFMGNSTPVESFDVNLHTLFIPLSPNYPGVDFLIWDTTCKLLFAFQVAISSPTSHRKSKNKFMEGENSLKSKWVTLCRINKDHVKFVWLVPDSFISSDKNNDSLYLSFSSIKNQFPALGDL
ncbi:34920_t:CDS:2, partial [Gigaspora margarita]